MNRRHWLFGVFPSVLDNRRRGTDGSSTGIPQIDFASGLPVEVICAAGLEKSLRCPIGIVSAEAAGSGIVDSKDAMVISLCSIRFNGRPVQELIRHKGILIGVSRIEVTSVPREMIRQGGTVSPGAQNVGMRQHLLCIDLLRWRRVCNLGFAGVWRRAKPQQARADDRSSRDEKNPFHYFQVTPSLMGNRSKNHTYSARCSRPIGSRDQEATARRALDRRRVGLCLQRRCP